VAETLSLFIGAVPTSPLGRHLVNFEESPSIRRTRRPESSPLGVYVKRKPKGVSNSQEISSIHQKCLTNAAVADSVMQIDKGDSWRWIAAVVNEVFQQSSRLDNINAWDGLSAGKLGNGVIDNILRYYEAKGDVQMLASIVCVLKSSCISDGKTTRWTFLQNDDWNRYNAYIKRYSELLYSWRQLTKCAEIKKFLFAESAKSDNATTAWQSATKATNDSIEISFKCPRCLLPTESGTNHCNTCQDFALRCSICDLAVRGLFTVCDVYVRASKTLLPFIILTHYHCIAGAVTEAM
jgi:hypothetical protein